MTPSPSLDTIDLQGHAYRLLCAKRFRRALRGAPSKETLGVIAEIAWRFMVGGVAFYLTTLTVVTALDDKGKTCPPAPTPAPVAEPVAQQTPAPVEPAPVTRRKRKGG